MTSLNLKPGDRAMLVSGGWGSRPLLVRAVTVKAVTPTGRISLKEVSEKYRPDGTAIGNYGPWTEPPRLRAWDDALWAEFSTQQENKEKAVKMFVLSGRLERIARDDELRAEAAALWDSLPDNLKAMAEDAQ